MGYTIMETPKICILGTDGEELDKYTEGIEVSNACRDFYVSRLKNADGMKKKLTAVPPSLGVTGLDKSMAHLRQEMASLFDQDLALMRQLLTLNEQIEELKWQRKLKGYCRSSTLSVSSCNVGHSACALDSDTNLHMSKDIFPSKYPTPSKLSLLEECFSTTESLDHTVLVHNSSQSEAETTPHNSGTELQTDGIGRGSTGRVMAVRGSTSDLGSSEELVHSVSDLRKSPGPRLGTDSAYSTCDDAKCKDGIKKIRAESEEPQGNSDAGSSVETKGQQSFDSGIQESSGQKVEGRP